MENIYLHGSEQVQSAGATISAASENMFRAASLIDDSLSQFSRRQEDQLQRFECAIDKLILFLETKNQNI